MEEGANATVTDLLLSMLEEEELGLPRVTQVCLQCCRYQSTHCPRIQYQAAHPEIRSYGVLFTPKVLKS